MPGHSQLRNAAPNAPHSAADAARSQNLARLVALWPGELDDLSIAGRRKLVAALWRALRAERRRGRHGHWAYDLARHADLYRAWSREQAALRQMLSQVPPGPQAPPPRKPAPA